MAEEKTAAQVAIYSGAEKMAELCLRAVSLMEASAEAACRAIAIEQLLNQGHSPYTPHPATHSDLQGLQGTCILMAGSEVAIEARPWDCSAGSAGLTKSGVSSSQALLYPTSHGTCVAVLESHVETCMRLCDGME